MTTDLIKRLEWARLEAEERTMTDIVNLHRDAAARIEQLEAEVAALKKEVKRYQWLSDRLGEICKSNLDAKKMQFAIDSAISAIAAQGTTDKSLP